MANKKNPLENLKGKEHILTDDDRRRAVQVREENRQKKKTYYDIAMIINEKKTSKQNMEALKKRGFGDADLNNQFLFVVSIFQRACKGDVNAMRLWLQITSQYTEEKEDLENQKLKAEIAKMKAETETPTDVEDLTPLVELLRINPTKADDDE